MLTYATKKRPCHPMPAKVNVRTNAAMEYRAAMRSFLRPGQRPQKCSQCEAEEQQTAPRHIGFTPEDLDLAATQEPEEGEMAPEKQQRPHAGSATIECKGGKYVVDLGSWGGKPCGIPDCVTEHEESHIKDWKKRWPNGCKKADGTNQPDGYLPLGGAGYAAFLKKSECDAHTVDLACARKKLRAAKGACRKKWRAYIKLTKKQKKNYC